MNQAPIQRVVVPDDLNSVEAIHLFLQTSLHFPEYYGRTLDGLWDCLGDLDEPVCIVWPRQWQTDNIWFVQKANQVLGVLMEAADEFANVQLELAE